MNMMLLEANGHKQIYNYSCTNTYQTNYTKIKVNNDKIVNLASLLCVLQIICFVIVHTIERMMLNKTKSAMQLTN